MNKHDRADQGETPDFAPERHVDVYNEGAANASRIREDRLAKIRSMIDLGTYETDERWETALSRMFADVGADT